MLDSNLFKPLHPNAISNKGEQFSVKIFVESIKSSIISQTIT